MCFSRGERGATAPLPLPYMFLRALQADGALAASSPPGVALGTADGATAVATSEATDVTADEPAVTADDGARCWLMTRKGRTPVWRIPPTEEPRRMPPPLPTLVRMLTRIRFRP